MKRGQHTPEAVGDEAIAMYLQGVAVLEICKRLNIDLGTLSRIRRRRGVPIRERCLTGPRHAGWRGGRIINSHGYVILYIEPRDPDPIAQAMAYGNGTPRVAEHRLVMAHHLGRPLNSDESVHHRNGKRADNRLENLELAVRYHGAGHTIDDAVADAVRILNTYAPGLLRTDPLLLPTS